MFNKIKEYNDNGTYYPAWGTCLGFEDFVIYAADAGEGAIEEFVVENASLPLKFVKDPRKTKMFKWLKSKAFAFEDNAFTYNAHNLGVAPAKFETDQGLREMFEVIATSKMPGDNATEFVSAFEGRKYPFFATGFHPEMTSQTWRVGNGVNHSWQSIQLNRHFADYFVFLARHNKNSFPDNGSASVVNKLIAANYDTIVTIEWWAAVYAFK